MGRESGWRCRVRRRTSFSAIPGREAQRTLAREAFSLLILDINLPDGSGLELLREQKSIRPEVPAILLTANDLELDEVTGLEAGADDYITKPFSLSVLRARVAVQLRRGRASAPSVVVTGPFRFDFDRMEFYRDGRAVELSKTEQKLLRVLVENRGSYREPFRSGGPGLERTGRNTWRKTRCPSR